jgi:hypothetical protein
MALGHAFTIVFAIVMPSSGPLGRPDVRANLVLSRARATCRHVRCDADR